MSLASKFRGVISRAEATIKELKKQISVYNVKIDNCKSQILEQQGEIDEAKFLLATLLDKEDK